MKSSLLHFMPGPGLVFVIKHRLRHHFSHFTSEKTAAQGRCGLFRVTQPISGSIRIGSWAEPRTEILSLNNEATLGVGGQGKSGVDLFRGIVQPPLLHPPPGMPCTPTSLPGDGRVAARKDPEIHSISQVVLRQWALTLLGTYSGRWGRPQA